MSQLSRLQRAKQGDTDAIASTIKYLLKDQKINATASIDNGCLKIILESEEILNQETSLPFIYKLVIKLEIKTIDSVKIYAKKVGEDLPLWTASIPLNVGKDKPKKQSQNQGQLKQTNEKVYLNQYPIWLPYPSSLWRTLILAIIGLPLAQVVVSGTGLIFIGFATPQFSTGSYLIITLGIILLLVSVLVISFFHSITKSLITKILPKSQNIFNYSNNLWEGLYGTIIMSISSLIILTIFAKLSFYDCQSLYNSSNLWACAGKNTGRFARIAVDSIQKQDFINKPWFSIWLIIVVYLYQIEFIIKHQLIPKILTRK